MANADRLIEVFNDAKARPAGGERERFLAEVCSTDPELKEQVLSLLQAHEGAGEFLKNTLVLSPTALVTEKPGDTIGRYKLLQPLGEGGCGVVYMAEQAEPVRRKVALKVIKLGMDTKQVVARFEAERQALALMDHPNIAKVFDAGATDAGRPYFVMELVRGIKITDYCDQNQLSTRERLDLFIQVCQAVQHAHQKGIIHRDLKPSNILVAQHDTVAVPKVIDFGIAKATSDQPLTDKTLFTAFEQFMGTPAYMSPEQAELNGLDIDTRTDIYSLGVLLYELLTGQPPFDPEELMKSGLEAMRKTIREQEPVKPSTRLTMELVARQRVAAGVSPAVEGGVPPPGRDVENGESSPRRAPSPPGGTPGSTAGGTPAATARRLAPEQKELIALLRGDLDWIVMKALEKDRTRRYETANGFAMDVRRYLADEPVTAAAPSVGYRFGKFVRRNKAALGVAAAVAVILIAATAASTLQAIRATRAEGQVKKRVIEVGAERDAKDKARQEAEAILTFLTAVFRSPDPARDGRTITVAETLDTAAKKLETGLANQPARRAKLQATLGRTYYALGLHRDAIPLFEKNRDYQLATFGLEHAETLKAISSLANSYAEAGRWREALKLREEVLALYRKVNGPGHPDTVSAMANMANSYTDAGRREEALKLEEEVLLLNRKVKGAEHPHTLLAMNNLAASYSQTGRWKQALKLREEVLPLLRKVNGPEDPDTLWAMANLANSYADAGRNGEALKLEEEVMALRRKVNGPEHSDTLSAMANLASSYDHAGRKDEALKMRQEVLLLRRKVNGPEHPRTLSAMVNLANSYVDDGRKSEALKLEEEVLALRPKVSGPEHPDTLSAMHNLASSYSDAGRRDEAIQLQEAVLRLRRKVSGPKHPDTLSAMSNLASSYSDAGRKSEALKLEEEVMALRPKVNGPEHPNTLWAMANLANSYDYAGRAGEALKLREEVLKLRRKVLGSQHPDTFKAMRKLAISYEQAGRKDEALKLEEELTRTPALRPKPAVGQPESAGNTLPARPLAASSDNQKYSLADSLYRQGRHAEAEPLYRELLQSQLKRFPATNETALGITASLARNLSDWAWAERNSTNKAVANDRAVEAERLLRDCFDARQRGTNANHWRTVDVKSRFGFARFAVAVTDGKVSPAARTARLTEAEPLLLESAAALQGEARVTPAYKRDSLERLVRLYEAWERPEKLAEWKQKLQTFDKAEAGRKDEALKAKAGDK